MSVSKHTETRQTARRRSVGINLTGNTEDSLTRPSETVPPSLRPSVCLTATLRVSPNRSQFFQYERLSLSCDWWGNSSGWRVLRNTSRHTKQACLNFRSGSEASYFLDVVYQTDSGAYWCQSAAGACSQAVRITVAGGFGCRAVLVLLTLPDTQQSLVSQTGL